MSEFEAEFFLKHFNGHTHAQFSTANAALACQRGLAQHRDGRYFHFEDAEGKAVTFDEPKRHPGHAYAILDILEREAKA